ncbi:FliA/WhiG family RNA polymerase sigma factor [Heliorestis acidaminivorans]|uniref:FliA/WhiG family RNA polymerase sigma factor n=1 Tax=Heliorestis acidaminivorans TaxID=553427 RepID=A0A6I0EUB7_9FIRM|nr:FliA/WhiG family RNA polymerase sigma factor [Heliorestis acidaminivorans]KAB2954375.1 FliA/WhiG family RNA polymerase sigma factor [Heliorestis acidaminivorans]
MSIYSKKEDTSNIWHRYKVQNDCTAREELILYYAPLVKYVASRLAILLPPNVDRDDLNSYGIFGLIDAIEKFDLARGLKFETYAIARIRGSILDGLRAMDWVPASLRQKAKEVEKTFALLAHQLGREANDEEVAEAMGLTNKEYQKLMNDLKATTLLSLDEYWPADRDKSDTFSLIETIVDENVEDPGVSIEFEELRQILSKAIDKLSDKERKVVALYYYEGLTLKEIGAVLNLSESRISQIHTKAILRLRGQLARQKKKIF